MKIHKIHIVLTLSIIVFALINVFKAKADTYDYARESISYLISPLGRAEYNNLGEVDLKGVKANAITLKTKVLLFENTEKIYYDPQSFLPYKIERTLAKFLGKEYITEEYDQKKFTVVVRRLKGKRVVREQIIKSNGPIQNVILFLFYLRKYPNLAIGWNFTAQVPAEFKVELTSLKLELVSIDSVTVPAGRYQAYHFKSIPNSFEVWVNKDDPRVPLKIKSNGIINYSVVMKKYTIRSDQ